MSRVSASISALTPDPATAAFVNGTAAHGEDFDDTFEGGPVHAGAVIVPAVLAACERYGRDGAAGQRTGDEGEHWIPQRLPVKR